MFHQNNLILILLFLICAYSTSYGQSHQWLSGGGGPYAAPPGYNAKDLTREIATDDNGNVYVITEFIATGSVTFDTMTFPIQTGINSMYRSKAALLSYSCNGHIRWGKIIEGTQDFRFSTIVYNGGNVYIAGVADGIGANERYFGTDSTMSGNYYSSWLIKYDTSGSLLWMRSQADNSVASYAPTGNWFCKVLMQDTLIHCIRSIFGSGAHLSPSVISHRGIYDYTYTPQGDLLNVVRLPLADSMLIVNIDMKSSIHSPTNTLYLSVVTQDSYQGSGMAVFDASRNLVGHDTFTTTGVSYGGTASGFRSGNAQYTLGTYFGANCTFKGQTFNNPFGNGRFGFVMKTDLNGNLIWKRQLNSVASTDVGLTAWNGDLSDSKIALTGFAKSVVIGSDTLILPGITGKIPVVVMDSSGNVVKMDFWNNDNSTGGIESGTTATFRKNNIYIGGTVTDSIWAGNSGYRSHGGPSDFFIAKYGYSCNCSPPFAVFTHTAPDATGLVTFTATSIGIDSVRWRFGDGSTSTLLNPSHTFLPGSYTACVTVYNACGNSQSCQTITIDCPQPSAAFNYTTTGNMVTTTYTGSAPVDSIRWDFGTGAYTTGFTANHTYPSSATYTICAISYKGCGTDTACEQVTLACPLPDAGFSYTASEKALQFQYNGIQPANTVHWSFGDNEVGTGHTTSHTYADAGSYVVCVTGTNSCGDSSNCQSIQVQGGVGIIDPADFSRVLVYPNPTARVLVIENMMPSSVLHIYDVSGKKLRNITITKPRENIDISSLSPGAYLLIYTGTKQQVSWRFIKE
ncbi:PKD domain-containing protein [Taibaiella koreensis]|uniref:PKD domain-containing protein n=1 Tax=Taibaiella koreensis TaxID=1268548 RepID=UPI000E5A0842|nr:PKD domain-containing protein [Taibaiella koreensis]